MTREHLAEIRARCQRATPGPWETAFTGSHTLCGSAIWRLTPFKENETVPMLREDAEFIAHARTDVPDLIAEVERLLGELGVANE